MQRRINIDMDNVVADFERHYEAVTGQRWRHLRDSHERWALLEGKQKGFFLTMPAAPGAVEFVAAVTALCQVHDCAGQFLTALPRLLEFPDAVPEKTQWAPLVLGSQLEVAFGPYAPDKHKHCRPGDILIDDNPRNIVQWYDAGGIGILHEGDLNASLGVLRRWLEGPGA